MTDRMEVTATVTNTGSRAGSQVVQLYVHDKVASRTRPVRELKGFERVTLNPGQSRTVRLSLTRDDLRFWGEDDWVVEPGEYDLWVATSSVDGDRKPFELI